MRILGISGSLRRGVPQPQAAPGGGRRCSRPERVLVEWDGLRGLPAFDEDLEDAPPEPVRELRDAIAAANAVLVATPEYNASIPGVLKNAFDWASRPFPENVAARQAGRRRSGPAPACSARSGRRRRPARSSSPRARTCSTPSCAVGMADGAFDEQGGLADPELRARLGELLAELAQEVADPGRAGCVSDGAARPPARRPAGGRASAPTRRATARASWPRRRARRRSAASSASRWRTSPARPASATARSTAASATAPGLALALLDEQTRAFQDALLSGPPPLGPGAPAPSACAPSARATSTWSSATATAPGGGAAGARRRRAAGLLRDASGDPAAPGGAAARRGLHRPRAAGHAQPGRARARPPGTGLAAQRLREGWRGLVGALGATAPVPA